MNDDLLGYYQQELAFIRKLGTEFAKAHPKIAGRLRLGAKTVEDPHVARLIEAFAFLTARINHKLDNDFPELTDALLGILYPHYQAPIPAMAILQLQPSEQLMSAKVIAQETLIASSAVHGEQCLFTTRYPVTLWPIAVQQAKLTGQPLQAPAITTDTTAIASLCLTVQGIKDTISLAELELDSLRFFINAPLQQAFYLYELLFNHTLAIALATSAQDPKPIFLDSTCLQPVGFAKEEGLLPYEARAFPGYCLLTDFFTCPEKFLFFDINHLRAALIEKCKQKGQSLNIYFYFAQTQAELEKYLTADYFALGCTPIVNLFEETAEPILLTHTKAEYPIVADAHRPPQALEVYAVKKVAAISETTGQILDYQSLYGIKHNLTYQAATYWHAIRKPAWQGEHYLAQGTEVFLAVTDLNFNPALAEKTVLSVEMLCSNRDLPNQLPFSNEEPYLEFWQTCGIPGYRARIRPIVSRITIHWPSFYNVVTGKTLALPNLIALQHIPLSPAGVIAKRPAPIALPNSCAAEWRMAPDAVFSPYASVRYFTPHMVHSQYNLL